ncbi:MAG TPA: hypothetical protein VFU20_05845 [Sphingomicrobium sp.]|nr:hypothetical protein [Sphingomicrobium sp.]
MQLDLSQLVKLVGELPDALAKTVRYGVEAWDGTSARTAQRRLRNMSVSLRNLIISNVGAGNELEDYTRIWKEVTKNGHRVPSAAGKSHLESAWIGVFGPLEAALEDGYSVLASVQKERSGFVITEGYHNLLTTLRTRAKLVQQLRGLPAPVTVDEMKEFRNFLVNYSRLRSSVEQCLQFLNEYAQTAELRSKSASGAQGLPLNKPAS